MRHAFKYGVYHCLFIILVIPLTALAEWAEDGNRYCTGSGHQSKPQIVLVEDGNFIVVWQDQRVAMHDTYANKIDIRGNVLWAADGVAICTASAIQRNPKLVSDGAGGAIVTWCDDRGPYDIYAQRVDTDGNVQWTVDGVAVCAETQQQELPEIVSDGAGGAIIVWQDRRDGYLNCNIYAQKIDANGNGIWTANGEPVCVDTLGQYEPQITTDGNGGAIMTWYDLRSSPAQVYAQRLGAGGGPQWTLNGVQLMPSADPQTTPQIVSDALGGAIVVWPEQASGFFDVYARKIGANGVLSWSATICTAIRDQRDPRITTDGNAGAIISWWDERSGAAMSDIYAQRVDYGGTVMWTADGVPVCQAVGAQERPEVVADGFGGAVVTWEDGRVLKPDVYAQRIDASGTAEWDADGIEIATEDGEQEEVAIAPDGERGAIVVWQDFRDAYYKVYAQRAERNGYWGYPAPVISGVRDIPGDQGGLVNLAWDASRLDPWPYQSITEYTVWRAIDHGTASSMIAGGAALVKDASRYDSAPPETTVRLEVTASGTFYWKLVLTADAYHLTSYAEDVPTLFDSTATSAELHYYQVIAHTNDPNVFWVSQPDSGYSVDNLAPAMPAMLAGAQNQPEGLILTWAPNSESDLAGYRVYRGTSGDFVPDTGNLVDSPEDTTSFDGDWRWDNQYYYKVSAVDLHGNESVFAVLGPDVVSGADSPGVALVTRLHLNYPNPFNPATTIRFELREAAAVTLKIYDASGRLIRTLVDRQYEAGRQEVGWDGRDDERRPAASGVYFCRMVAAGDVFTRKMVLIK